MNGHAYAPAGALGGYSWFTPPTATTAPQQQSAAHAPISPWIWGAGAAVVGVAAVWFFTRKGR